MALPPSLHYSIIVQVYGQLPPLQACQTSRGEGSSIRRDEDIVDYETHTQTIVQLSSTILVSYGFRFQAHFKWHLVQVWSGILTWAPGV